MLRAFAQVPRIAASFVNSPAHCAVRKPFLRCLAAREYSNYGGNEAEDRISPQDLQVGQQLQGIVTNIVQFGCFVDVGATCNGLIHISQLTDGFVKDVNDVVAVGDEVSVRVLSIDGDRRLSLTMKSEGGGGRSERAPRNRGGESYSDEPRSYDREPRRDRDRW